MIILTKKIYNFFGLFGFLVKSQFSDLFKVPLEKTLVKIAFEITRSAYSDIFFKAVVYFSSKIIMNVSK